MNIFDFINIQIEGDVAGTASTTSSTASDATECTGEVVRSYMDLILGYDPCTKEYDLSNLVVMLILFVLLGVTIFIFVERYLTIRKSLQGEKDFMRQVKNYVEDGKLDAAVQLCRSTDNPVARMVEKGILRIGKPMEDIATSIENVAKMEVYSLEARMSILATISGVAPMLGMLGTVLGMVGTLSAMAATGSPSIQDISSGIYVAMVTTIGGLVVGILAYAFYNYLVSKVEKVIQKMEGGSIEFLDILEAPGK